MKTTLSMQYCICNGTCLENKRIKKKPHTHTHILIFYELSVLFYGFAPARNEGMYAQTVPFLVLLMQPSSDGIDHIIIRLKFPSADNIFQWSGEVKI